MIDNERSEASAFPNVNDWQPPTLKPIDNRHVPVAAKYVPDTPVEIDPHMYLHVYVDDLTDAIQAGVLSALENLAREGRNAASAVVELQRRIETAMDAYIEIDHVRNLGAANKAALDLFVLMRAKSVLIATWAEMGGRENWEFARR